MENRQDTPLTQAANKPAFPIIDWSGFRLLQRIELSDLYKRLHKRLPKSHVLVLLISSDSLDSVGPSATSKSFHDSLFQDGWHIQLHIRPLLSSGCSRSRSIKSFATDFSLEHLSSTVLCSSISLTPVDCYGHEFVADSKCTVCHIWNWLFMGIVVSTGDLIKLLKRILRKLATLVDQALCRHHNEPVPFQFVVAVRQWFTTHGPRPPRELLKRLVSCFQQVARRVHSPLAA